MLDKKKLPPSQKVISDINKMLMEYCKRMETPIHVAVFVHVSMQDIDAKRDSNGSAMLHAGNKLEEFFMAPTTLIILDFVDSLMKGMFGTMERLLTENHEHIRAVIFPDENTHTEITHFQEPNDKEKNNGTDNN